MAQLSIFQPAEKPSARTATKSTRPTQKAKSAKAINPPLSTAFSPPSAFRAALAAAQAKVNAERRREQITQPQPSSQPSADAIAPYGTCHRCTRALAVPGLDASYCKACGWLTRPQRQWVGGAK